MSPEQHIWACAHMLIKQYDNNTWYHASTRADTLLAANDFDGYNIMIAVLRKIEALENMKPTGLVH